LLGVRRLGRGIWTTEPISLGCRFEKRFHVHEPRHFAATALDEQGMVGKLRTEIVGHANEEITNSIYTHVRSERVAAVAVELRPAAVDGW
jgi:integrase